MKHATLILAAASLLRTSATAADIDLNKRTLVLSLTSPVSSKTSKQGDQITCRVLEPADLQGAVVTGKVIQVTPPEKGMRKPTSALLLGFETLTVTEGGQSKTYKVKTDLREISNSKGIKGVDEEGRAIAKTKFNWWKFALIMGLAAAGGAAAASQGAGAATTAAAAGGAAVAAYVIASQFTTKSESIELGSGSQFVAVVREVR